jgi:Ti-type conjugative transfer relaxase TraA
MWLDLSLSLPGAFCVAVYHFSAKVIGRSGGRSAIASAAYRAGERLHDDKLDRDHDYTEKSGVVHREIMLPDGAPSRWLDRGTLWNEVEAGEKRKDAQLARDIEISLPREMGKAEAIKLAQDFVREQFVARGMVADLNVHWTQARDGGEQPHAHIMLSMREVVPGREGHEEEGAFGKKVTAWNSTDLLRDWRVSWAEKANERLREKGLEVQIDHRSYADQGIDLEPQHKIGPAGIRREDREKESERAAEHREIARRNGDKLLEEPAIALRALTQQHSTFSRQDLARFVNRHSDGAEQFASVVAKVEAAPELVRLGEDTRGRERFTTREMLETERRMERAGAVLAERERHGITMASALQGKVEADRVGLVLGPEQAAALEHVTNRGDLALVVGYAGTGKSAMLGVARATWEAERFHVRGLALSGIAAEGLEAGSGIASRTIASLEFAWKDGRDELTSRDILVVDEAGMVGSRQMERLLSAAQSAGAKVVLIGDPEQLQAIEAGAAFRALAERHGAAEISEVRRQREDWQREATQELATERTAQALGRYTEAGMVHAAETREAAKAELVRGWNTARQESPSANQMILAYTRDDVRDLNALARAELRASGELCEADQVVQTERGARGFAAGDRLMFLRNERGLGGDANGRNGVAVKNGTLGRVLEVASGGERLTVQLDSPGRRVVTFYTRDYAHIDHGYAATVHKAQGVTVDRAHVLATPHMDRHAAYVALTRHRDGVALHYGRDDFGEPTRLARSLSRERAKDTTLDYDKDENLVRRYAERRGLAPESQIIVRPERGVRAPVQEQAAERPSPKRGKFSGLKLDARTPAPNGQAERQASAPEPVPARILAQGERQQAQLEGVVADYARAWSDAERMRQAELPVLPHQAIALETAARALDAFGSNASRDVRTALEADPGLVRGIETAQGRQALTQAAAETHRTRLALEERGLGVVRAWNALERDYETASKAYEWDARREIGTRMEAFAKELKRDPQLDSLLRTRGRELGIAAGSRLDQVVRAQEIDRALTRSIDIEHGPRERSGPSLGR